jgi:hypothetical protein
VSRSGRVLSVLSVALLFVAWVSASAETGVYASGAVEGEYLYNTDVTRDTLHFDASVTDTRIDIDVVVGPVTLGAAYRAYLLSDVRYNPQSVTAPPTELKHRYAALELPDLFIRAGHFSETFGHGVTLRSYEEVDLEHDTYLDGFLTEYQVGDVSLTALSGTAINDVEGSRYFEHVVSAARAAAPFTDFAEVAASVVQRTATQKDDEIEIPSSVAREKDVLVGTELSVWAGPVSLAAEYATRDGENPVTGGDEIQGHAIYASGTIGLGPVTLFGEVKDYDDYEHYLVNPPTAVREHLWTEMNRVTYLPDLNDERGFLVEGSGTVGEALFLDGGLSEARNHDSDLRHWEMFGQVDWTPSDLLTASAAASWSREYQFVAEEATGKFDEHLSGALSGEFELGVANALEVTLEAQATEDVFGASYQNYLASLALYLAADWTLIATTERTTSETEAREQWFMAEARRLISDDFEVSLSAGTERGGKKCTGGVCFDEPEFEGVRMRFTRFF